MLGLGRREGLETHIRPYLNGRDALQRSRNLWVIDLFGLNEVDVRQRFPEVYEHLLSRVWDYKVLNKKTQKWEPTGRKYNNRQTYKDNWWIFGEPRGDIRPALHGLVRYIATVETSKHRVFQFLDVSILPDNMIIVFAIDSSFHLGIVQSSIHTEWALRAGGWLGIGNDSRYSKSKVFDSFPFPDPTSSQRGRIACVAEELDARRKAALAEVPGLTMTEIYNLRDLKRGGAALDFVTEERATRARAGTVAKLHDELDAAVAAAYGWPADLAPSEIITRLVALNHERAAEEAAGTIRWLRPDYQIPRFGSAKPAKRGRKVAVEADDA